MTTVAMCRRSGGARLCGLAVLLLAACEAHALTATMSRSATVSTGSSLASGDPSASSSTGELAPACSAEDAKQNCHHRIILEGLTVEEATRQARAAGFTLDIKVAQLNEYDAACKPDTVCRADPDHWQIYGETLWLYVNPKVAITAPE
jgi:hypothetical protein